MNKQELIRRAFQKALINSRFSRMSSKLTMMTNKASLRIKRSVHAVRGAIALFVMLLILSLFPAPRGFAADLITSIYDWVIPDKGVEVPWSTIPHEVQIVLEHGLVSRDGQWTASYWSWYQLPADVRLAMENGKMPFNIEILKTGPVLWIVPSDRSYARLIDRVWEASSETMLWTPQNSLIYYYREGDTWLETNPLTGRTNDFLPGLFKGNSVGFIRFSPDGSQMLYNTGVVYGVNKPSPSEQVTWLASSTGEHVRQVGVDLDVTWQGNQISTTVLEPDIIFINHLPQGSIWTVQPGNELMAWVRAATSVEWRFYHGEPDGQSMPFQTLQAEQGDKSGVWSLRWPDLSEEMVYLEAWAKAKPGVELSPALREEEGVLWRVLGPFQAKINR